MVISRTVSLSLVLQMFNRPLGLLPGDKTVFQVRGFKTHVIEGCD